MLPQNAVLFVNEAFYHAFTTGDLSAMDELWSREARVTCIHPGWHSLTTREEIMGVWRRMFADGRESLICREPQASVMGDVAVVVCYEQLPDRMLVATNIFRRELTQWRMVHHQSGATASYPARLSEAPEPSRLAH